MSNNTGSRAKCPLRLAVMVATFMAVTLPATQAQGNGVAGPLGTVEVTGGQLQGVATDVAGVTLFKGIPYAGPTGGKNRFRPAQPVAPWEGVRVADTWGDQAMQNVNLNPTGAFWGDEFYYDPDFMPPASENGLNLNVFTPAQSADAKLPVYVWIHGGGNDHGYASEIEFYASKLAAKGIRVGVFGWLSLESGSPSGAAGNMGLGDLITALKWVRDNIAGFGGNPETVTIGGQSAGSRNVGMLLRSPEAEGLFHQAVMESASGGLLQTEYPSRAEQEIANAVALDELFGKPVTVADLRAIPAEDFVTKTLGPDDQLMHYALDEVIGGQFVIDGTLLTNASVDLLQPGALDGIDLMIGSNADERTSLNGGPDETMSEEDFVAYMEDTYGNDWNSAYAASDPQHAYRLQLRAQADNLLQTSLASAEYAANHNEDMNAFVYYFDNPPPGRNSEFYGSFHSSDLWYFFNSLRDEPGQRPWTGTDYRMADTMSSYLANFVKTGNPNGDGLPAWLQPTDGSAFIRFADGYAYPVTTTPYPERDQLNRAAVLEEYGLTNDQLSN